MYLKHAIMLDESIEDDDERLCKNGYIQLANVSSKMEK